MRFAVDIMGNVLIWHDGKWTCEDKEFEKNIRDACKEAEEKDYMEIYLDGSLLYGGKGIDPGKSPFTAYGFLQGLSGGRMKFVTGLRPTWDDLGAPAEGDTTY